MDSKCRKNGPARWTLNGIETEIDCRYECFNRADCSYFTYYPECERCYLWNEGDKDLNVNLANAKVSLAGLKMVSKSHGSYLGARFISPKDFRILTRPGFSSLEGIVSGGKYCFVGKIFSQILHVTANTTMGQLIYHL